MTAPSVPSPRALPALRPELRLIPGARTVLGEPSWLIHDPLLHRFIEIDQSSYEMLSFWHRSRTLDEFRASAASHGIDQPEDAIRGLLSFAERNHLVLSNQPRIWRSYTNQSSAAEPTALGWLLHNYLYVRLPLINPQPYLLRTLPFARVLASKVAIGLYLLLGSVGLYLASRQWELFLATWPELLTWEGAIVAGLVFIGLKAAHELGHAYTAIQFGCQVPSMGVAFMLLAPMPYTDVTDAWRLKDRRQRLRIDSAGVMVETAIACVALFLWAFLPDGAARTTAFLVATISLAATLLINVNPLMRFDGYYILSELVGIKNLQSPRLRAWRVGRAPRSLRIVGIIAR